MELFHLRYFLKVAARENFTRAAEELSLSQPALSRAIAHLEAELGQPLFERQARRVRLTDAGRLLQSRAQQIVALVDDTRAEINDDGQSGRIRIGAIPTVAPFFLPGLLRKFAAQYPKAAVIVQEDVTESLLKRCSQGEIDIAVLALPLTAKYLEVEELFDEELLLVLPMNHPLASRKRLTLEDVQTYPFVLLDEAHCLSENIVSLCRQRAFHPVSVERTSQLATVQELVALDHGISLIPAMARAVDESNRRLYRSFTGTVPTRRIVMLWNPYRFQSKVLEHFKEELRAYARDEAAALGR